MKITVSKEEGKEILSSKVKRLHTGVEKLTSLVEAENWKDAEKIMNVFLDVIASTIANLKEISSEK